MIKASQECGAFFVGARSWKMEVPEVGSDDLLFINV